MVRRGEGNRCESGTVTSSVYADKGTPRHW